MAQPVIRERTANDLPGCVEGLRAVHVADGYPLNWPSDPAGWLSPELLVRAWIASLPEIGPAGHVALQGVPGSPELVEVSRLFVVPTARRRGIAEALVRQATEWSRAAGLQPVLNVVDEARSAAMSFYEASGWLYTHTTTADWKGHDGSPVRLRHYRLSS